MANIDPAHRPVAGWGTWTEVPHFPKGNSVVSLTGPGAGGAGATTDVRIGSLRRVAA